MSAHLRILFMAAEAAPLVKVGGLGDVAGALPPALRALPEKPDVRLVIPFHGSIGAAVGVDAYPFERIARFSLPSTNGSVEAQAFFLDYHGLPIYLISGGPIQPYQPVYTTNGAVDGLKFTFFSLAALELARAIDWRPDILHANDWHTAPAVYALSRGRANDEFYQHTATLLGVHNLPYLGHGAASSLAAFGLPPALDSALPAWAQHLPFPLGLLTADHIVAASPTYAQEILTPEFGAGLHEFLQLRQSSISGILNGLDTAAWDPADDSALVATYTVEALSRRKTNKAALQDEFGLPRAAEVPLLAMVTRMDHQKGVDLLPEALRLLLSSPATAALNWQVVLLGTGDPAIETLSRNLAIEFPQRVRVAIRFDSGLSRRIFGGADLLLMPSRYEPCGLTQMIAMRYGCIPIASAVGGLRDTIRDVSHVRGSTGFLFSIATPEELAHAIQRAVHLYPRLRAWRGLQRRGMLRDFSWTNSANQYYDLYRYMLRSMEVL